MKTEVAQAYARVPDAESWRLFNRISGRKTNKTNYQSKRQGMRHISLVHDPISVLWTLLGALSWRWNRSSGNTSRVIYWVCLSDPSAVKPTVKSTNSYNYCI